MPADSCPACGGTEGRVHDAREMMFGLREPFRYVECATCGCLRLVDVPRDLSRFYPDDYYSFASKALACSGGLERRLRRARAGVLLRLPPIVASSLERAGRAPTVFTWLGGAGLSTRSAICDVGAGGGDVLRLLHREGFSDLTGVDPFLEADREVAPGVWVLRRELQELDRGYDLVMVNHAFEHMASPLSVLERLRDLLAPGGLLLIRVPVADSWAWRTYRTDWVGLDAPRHLIVPTTRAMEILAQRAALRIDRKFRDSYGLQFWGSEQYRHDIPLRDPRSVCEAAEGAIFSASDLREFETRSRVLNRRGEGDSAGFLLRRA